VLLVVSDRDLKDNPNLKTHFHSLIENSPIEIRAEGFEIYGLTRDLPS
jgi:hypothetical protein